MSVGHKFFKASLVSSCTLQSLRYIFANLMSSYPLSLFRCICVTYSPTQNRPHSSYPPPMDTVYQEYRSSALNLLQGWYKIVWHSLTHLPFFYPRVNLTDQLVKPVNDPPDFPEVISTFTSGELKELGQNYLKSLNLVKKIPQTCKG